MIRGKDCFAAQGKGDTMRKFIEKILVFMVVCLVIYIRYQRTEIEILRFDCMMKQMKESRNSDRK